MRTINILAGPTASGKTQYALQWARANGAEIVNADSTLVYRGMDIGTAKPTAQERLSVPHHLINMREPSESYCIADYLKDARVAIDAIHNAGKKVLVVGGSFFYLRAYFEAVTDEYPPSAEQRAAVRNLEASEGLSGLLRELRRLNPEGFGALDVQNPRRVARALERCGSSGKTLLELQAEFRKAKSPFEIFNKHAMLIDAPEAVLKERIVQRTQSMLERGLIEEVRGLLERGIRKNPVTKKAIGYRQTIAWLREGSDDVEALRAAIHQASFKYMHAQCKWFAKNFKAQERITL